MADAALRFRGQASDRCVSGHRPVKRSSERVLLSFTPAVFALAFVPFQDVSSVLALASTCRRLRWLLRQECVWSVLLQRDFPVLKHGEHVAIIRAHLQTLRKIEAQIPEPYNELTPFYSWSHAGHSDESTVIVTHEQIEPQRAQQLFDCACQSLTAIRDLLAPLDRRAQTGYWDTTHAAAFQVPAAIALAEVPKLSEQWDPCKPDVILASDFAPFGPLRLKPAHSNRELSCDSQQRNHVPHALSAPEMLWRMKSTLSRLFAQDEDEFRLFLTAADTDASVDQPARVELPFHLHNARLRLNRRMNDGSPVTILSKSQYIVKALHYSEAPAATMSVVWPLQCVYSARALLALWINATFLLTLLANFVLTVLSAQLELDRTAILSSLLRVTLLPYLVWMILAHLGLMLFWCLQRPWPHNAYSYSRRWQRWLCALLARETTEDELWTMDGLFAWSVALLIALLVNTEHIAVRALSFAAPALAVFTMNYFWMNHTKGSRVVDADFGVKLPLGSCLSLLGTYVALDTVTPWLVSLLLLALEYSVVSNMPTGFRVLPTFLRSIATVHRSSLYEYFSLIALQGAALYCILTTLGLDTFVPWLIMCLACCPAVFAGLVHLLDVAHAHLTTARVLNTNAAATHVFEIDDLFSNTHIVSASDPDVDPSQRLFTREFLARCWIIAVCTVRQLQVGTG